MKIIASLIVIAASMIWIELGVGAAERNVTPTASKGPEAKKDYELPADRKNIPREQGGWINVQTSGAQMITKFFDAEKKPVEPDVARATARFRYVARSDMERTVLNREGEALVSPGNVRPPHNFLVTLVFLHGAEDSDSPHFTETYNFKFP